MKSFTQIKNEALRGDYGKVAELAGCSRKNVELVVKEARPDNYNVQQIFSNLLAQRNELRRTCKKLRGAYKGDNGAMMGMSY